MRIGATYREFPDGWADVLGKHPSAKPIFVHYNITTDPEIAEIKMKHIMSEMSRLSHGTIQYEFVTPIEEIKDGFAVLHDRKRKG
jgi:hypothetical protein